MNIPFKPGDVVYLKSHPQNKMTVEECRYSDMDKTFMVKCFFQDPVTRHKLSDEYNYILLEKSGSDSSSYTFVDPIANTPPTNTAEQPMFKAIFSIDGRIRRLEYGLTAVIFSIAFIIIEVLIHSGHIMAAFIYIPLVWALVAQRAKRSHDLGTNGWYQFIPLYGFWLLFQDGQPGPNKYGPNPKGQ